MVRMLCLCAIIAHALSIYNGEYFMKLYLLLPYKNFNLKGTLAFMLFWLLLRFVKKNF